MPLFNAAVFNAALFGGTVPAPGPLAQVGEGILYPALRKAAITLAPGRTPSPAQFQDALDELNRLTGSLNCDRMFIYSIDTEEFPLNPVKMSYTIGQPADPFAVVDFAAPRPQLIDRANIVMNGLRYPLALVTDLQWSRIRLQTLPNTIPRVLYNDRASPVSTLSLWGQPQPGQSLELFVWHQVPYAVSLTDVITAPFQYVDALVLNLAVRLVTHFPDNRDAPRQVDPNLYQQARESLMRLESINAPQPTLDVACGCKSGYMNVYSGEIY